MAKQEIGIRLLMKVKIFKLAYHTVAAGNWQKVQEVVIPGWIKTTVQEYSPPGYDIPPWLFMFITRSVHNQARPRSKQ